MKESFKRIVDWTKKHPWLAGGILAIVVVLAWLSYKNGWFGGGGSSASVDTSTPPTDTSGGTLPPVVGGVGGDAGGTTTTMPPVTLPPVTLPPVGNVGGGGGDGFTLPPSSNLDNLFGGPVSVAPDAGSQPQAADAYNNNVGTAAKAISQGADLVATHSGVDTSTTPAKQADAYSANVGTAAKAISQGVTLVRDTTYPTGTPLVSSNFPQVTGEVGAGSNKTGGSVKVTSGRTITPVSVSKTPAAILGLASNYTGWYGNTYYVNGYPSTQQVNANTSSGRTLGRS